MSFLDAANIFISFFLAYWLRQRLVPLPDIQSLAFHVPFIVVSLISFLFSFVLFRLYDKSRPLLSLSYLVDYLKALVLWATLLVAFSYFTKTDYSRAVVILFFASAALLLSLVRFFIAWLSAPPASSMPGDSEILKSVSDVVRLSRFSPDKLALLEGLRSHRSPGTLYLFSKRLLDIVLSLAGLILTSFLFPLISLWIRHSSPGKAIIRQERIGEKGKRFILYKFRTMVAHTPLYAPAPRYGEDVRITRVGKILRKYSLDELPQLFNVLRGEMSIVGPRPEMPFVVEKYEPWQRVRFEVKPGITGLWQILGRKDLPLEENLEYDLYYVFHQSLFLDIAIIIKTIPHLIFSRGAY
ncbi:MAG: sugar transferase [Candidatus Ryanbacteria bacterium]|nr:sugar transferase [Candidatus Ryanbacteria bacterium]